MGKKTLCIGGIADGRWRFDDGTVNLVVSDIPAFSVQDAVEMIKADRCITDSEFINQSGYRRLIIGEHYVWVDYSLTAREAMDRLLKGYKPCSNQTAEASLKD